MAKATYRYVDDQAKNWSIRMEAVPEPDATARGLAAADGTEQPMVLQAKSIRPRKCAAIRSDGKTVWLVCGTASCTAYAVMGTGLTRTYAFRNAVAKNATVYGYHGERRIYSRPAPPA